MDPMNRVLVVVSLVLAMARGAAAESREFRMATVAPAGSPWMDLLDKAASEIAAKTDKRVTIKYFPGGQQGDERDFIRKIKLGQLDGAALTAIGLAQIDPSILVLQLPMLFTSREEIDYVADKMWPYFQKKFEKKGFRLADRGEIGWIYFFSKNKVSSMDDLRKQKLWILNDDLGSTMLDRLKIQGVPLGLPEVDAALTSGRINACFSSPLGAVAHQWYTKVKYRSSTPMVFAIGATVISLDTVNKVSAEDQKTIESIAKRSSKKARTVIRQADDDARKTLVRKGITVVDPPKEMVDELTAMAGGVQGELTGKVFSKEELEMVLGYRDEYRKKHAKK
jgi:TRAP-type C4-dicarboxylate transport system substrate-binding protein